MNKILTVICTGLFVISCQKTTTSFTDSFSQKQVCNLAEMMEYPADSIGHADFIFSHEDFILLSEPKSDYLLSLYNIKTKAFNRFLTKGNGPYDLLDVQQINLYKDDSSFFVKSTFGENLYVYKFDNPYSNDDLRKIKIKTNTTSIFFDENNIIYSQYGKKRFAIYNTQNEFLREFGDSINIDNCTQELVSHIIQGLCLGNTKLQRYVWASVYGDIFEIYDYKNINQIKTIASVKSVLPIVTISQNQPIFSTDTKLGIVSLTATDAYIYMLYNENIIKNFESQKDDILLCNKILIFDWDGNPHKILKLNRKIRSISYNRKYDRIYCIGYDDNNDGKIFFINVDE
jgi:hypothetical protein